MIGSTGSTYYHTYVKACTHMHVRTHYSNTKHTHTNTKHTHTHTHTYTHTHTHTPLYLRHPRHMGHRKPQSSPAILLPSPSPPTSGRSFRGTTSSCYRSQVPLQVNQMNSTDRHTGKNAITFLTVVYPAISTVQAMVCDTVYRYRYVRM